LRTLRAPHVCCLVPGAKAADEQGDREASRSSELIVGAGRIHAVGDPACLSRGDALGPSHRRHKWRTAPDHVAQWPPRFSIAGHSHLRTDEDRSIDQAAGGPALGLIANTASLQAAPLSLAVALSPIMVG